MIIVETLKNIAEAQEWLHFSATANARLAGPCVPGGCQWRQLGTVYIRVCRATRAVHQGCAGCGTQMQDRHVSDD